MGVLITIALLLWVYLGAPDVWKVSSVDDKPFAAPSIEGFSQNPRLSGSAEYMERLA